MSIKDIYKILICWQYENGEGVIEYFGDNYGFTSEKELMEWMYKKKYISKDKLDLFYKSGYSTICDCLCGYEIFYSLFPYGECDEEADCKAIYIISEYLYENNMIDKLKEFAFGGKGWAYFDSKEEKERYNKNLRNRINSWDESDDEEFNKIYSISIKDINNRLEEENK